MDWIANYQLYLFDLDGLLVNTEPLHFAAYARACKKMHIPFDWDFSTYCYFAYTKPQGVLHGLSLTYPQLALDTELWNLLYDKKSREYVHIIKTEDVELMCGVEKLLKALTARNILSCVVTNSCQEQVSIIRKKKSALQSIPYWISRDLYTCPKPDPECYNMAISKYAQPMDKVIGFEDTLKGWTALNQSRAKAVLICSRNHPQLQEKKNWIHYPSFSEIKDL